VIGNGKSQFPVDGVLDSDAGSDQTLGELEAVVTHLERRFRIEDVEPVVCSAGEGEGLA